MSTASLGLLVVQAKPGANQPLADWANFQGLLACLLDRHAMREQNEPYVSILKLKLTTTIMPAFAALVVLLNDNLVARAEQRFVDEGYLPNRSAR